MKAVFARLVTRVVCAAVSVVLFLLVFTISIVQSRFLKPNWEY